MGYELDVNACVVVEYKCEWVVDVNVVMLGMGLYICASINFVAGMASKGLRLPKLKKIIFFWFQTHP